MEKIEANQGLPYKLMRNRLLRNQEYKDLLYIANKNIPEISSSEVVDMFKKLSNSGCSCAMLANSLTEQVYKNSEEFKNIFGFSILTKGKVDCNKLMVDIYSKLYKVMKFKFTQYNSYKFSSIKEAYDTLVGKGYENDIQAMIELFNAGVMANGKDNNNNLLFRSKIPNISNYVGSCEQVSKEKFGINGVKTIEELKKICSDKNIELECKDIEIYQKLTGLGTDNFNFWSNYYLNQYNVNFNLLNERIVTSDFNQDYKSFMTYINNLILNGYSISVSTGPNNIAYMHTKKKLSWSKISSEAAGHIMLFKNFDKNHDIVVSSYGEDYIIPKEYFNALEFKKIKAIEKDDINIQKMSR